MYNLYFSEVYIKPFETLRLVFSLFVKALFELRDDAFNHKVKDESKTSVSIQQVQVFQTHVVKFMSDSDQSF